MRPDHQRHACAPSTASAPAHVRLTTITPAEVRHLAECVAFHFLGEQDEIARFMLLVHVLTNAPTKDREDMYTEITNWLAPYSSAYDNTVRETIAGALDGVRQHRATTARA